MASEHPRTRRDRPPIRRPAILILVGVLLAALLAACGGTTPASTDPYAIVAKALDASYERLKVQVGASTTGNPDGDITIDPSAIELVLDTKAGQGSFHLSLPVSALGSEAEGLAQLGITGDTLDAEILFDGEAVYARSPLFASILPMLLAQAGQTVSGDLTGWLKLGTAADLAGLTDTLGALPQASAAPSQAIADLDAAGLKQQLEDAGIVLAHAGSEQRNGVDAEHLTVTIDFEKLAGSPMAGQLPADQLAQVKALAGQAPLAIDLWFDKATGRLTELTGKGKADGQEGSFTVLLSDPGTVAIEAPADAVEVPLAPMLMSLMTLFGGSLGS